MSFGFAMALFIFMEFVRLHVETPWIKTYMDKFSDHRDQGPLILSHIYLLLGCSLPLWLTSTSSTIETTISSSGCIVLGIGDSAVSWLSRFSSNCT